MGITSLGPTHKLRRNNVSVSDSLKAKLFAQYTLDTAPFTNALSSDYDG